MKYSHEVILSAIGLILLVTGISIALFDGWALVVSCMLGWIMIAIMLEDATRMIIPDALSLPAIPAGLLATALMSTGPEQGPRLLDHLLALSLAAVALYTLRWVYQSVHSAEGLGLGDVKLAAAAGAWTGLQGLGPTLLLACIAAALFILGLRLLGRPDVTRKTAVPFGAFLAPAIWLVWAYIQRTGTHGV